MSPSTKQKRVDELLQGAAGSLTREAFFEAERMALKAVTLAHQIEDYARMAAACQPLREARLRRRELALASNEVTIVEEAVTEKFKIDSACYLIQPPQVGADARRLRMAALQSEIPVTVICREPLTQLGLWPIVAIGPGATVRTKVDPPADQQAPDIDWYIDAMQALGEAAIGSIDAEAELTRRVRFVLERLDSVPDHDGLHDLLEQTCLEAAKAVQAKAKATAGRAKTKAKT